LSLKFLPKHRKFLQHNPEARQQVSSSDVAQEVGSEDHWMIFDTYFNAILQKCTEMMMMPEWK